MVLAAPHEMDSDVDPERLLMQETAAASRASPRRRAALTGALLLGLAAASLLALHARGVTLERTSLLFQQKVAQGHPPGPHGKHPPPKHGPAHPPVAKFFQESDKDKDGQLAGGELKEFSASLEEKLKVTDQDFKEAMKAADKNGDGKLAKTELPALMMVVHQDSAAHKRFSVFDQDHNGKVEGKELEDLTKRMEDHFGVADKDFQAALTAADKNKDGKLEGGEAAAFLAELHKDITAHHQHHGQGHKDKGAHHQHHGQGQEHKGAGAHHQPHGQGQNLHTFDHDGDGRIKGDELKELKAAMLKRFKLDEAHLDAAVKASDKNSDGALELLKEMPMLFQKLHGSQMAARSFQKYDEDGNGKVEGKELEKLKSNMEHHFKVQERDFKKMFQAADANKDGKLEEGEAPLFMQELHKVGMRGHSKISWLDKDKNGLVEGRELKDMEAKLRAHHKVTDAEFKRIVAEADKNGDGKLAQAEVHTLMAGLHEESLRTHRADMAIKRLAE